MDSIGKIASGITPTEVIYEEGLLLNNCGPNAYAIQAVVDTTFDVLDCYNLTGTGLEANTLVAGQIWYLDIKRFKLLTGSVLVYKY